MNFIKKLLGGDEHGKTLKRVQPFVDRINALEPEIQKLSDEELAAKTQYFKKKLEEGATLDDIMEEAFAVVREAAIRTVGMRHYDVQLIGGVIIHEGSISEMRTGEGKTLVATLPVYLNALAGEGVHVVTVNDYLARRDAVWMGQVYAFLGLSIGVINSENQGSFLYDLDYEVTHEEEDEDRDETGFFKVAHEFLRPCTRQEAYKADITYGTNNEFGFDYLRDNIAYDKNQLRQRGHRFAIIDEIDSILIDEARTPLIISAPAQQSGDLYTQFADIANRLVRDTDFEVDEKKRAITLTDEGIEKVEKMIGVDNIYTDKGIKFVHHLETAVRAKALFERDKEYVVRDGQVVIVDQFTGRMMPGRRYSEGLHQAIEAKEGVEVQRESRTFASVTFQNYFRLYKKVSGMTGTAITSREEFLKVYALDVVVIPTNKPIARIDNNDYIFQTEGGKFKAIATKIKEINEKGQPVLIGTVSIEKNELLSDYLRKMGVKHQMLNAKQHEREGEIIADAGRKGAVTIATNMAGRGVDIKLGGSDATEAQYEEIKSLGGLFVLGTERHEARRIDDQLRGRSGRQGDPGETHFFVSLEDDLMRVFASDTIKTMMGRFGIPEDQPIENKMITRSLESAQTKIEGFNFDSRKSVLSFDDVLNKQRKSLYARRRKILTGTDEDVEELLTLVEGEGENLSEVIEQKKEVLGQEVFYENVRKLALQAMDLMWVDHLEIMDYTRSSVNFRAYGQRDPLVEYKKEGTRLFRELEESVNYRIAELIPHMGEGEFRREQQRLQAVHQNAKLIGGSKNASDNSNKPQPVVSDAPKNSEGKKIGRNDVVEITNGTETRSLKYKKAQPLVESGEWSLK